MNVRKHVIQKECAMTLQKNFVSRVSRFVTFEKTRDGVVVTAELTDKFNRGDAQGLQDLYDNYAGAKKPAEKTGTFRIRYSFCGPDIVRVTTGLAMDLPLNRFEADYFRDIPAAPAFTFEEDAKGLTLATDKVVLRINKKSPPQCQGQAEPDILSFDIRKKNGELVLREEIDEKSIYFGYFAPPLGRERGEDGDNWTIQSFARHGNEDFYGFGEQFTDFNKRAQVIDTWNSDSGNCSANLSYKNIPFFISTAGYGFLMGSDRHCRFDMGSRTQAAWTVKVHGGHLDYFVIVDPKPAGILKKYFSLTGRPGTPPKWSYGLWMSSIYNSADQVIDAVRKFRELGFPGDVIHIDPPWMGLDSLLCNLEWSPKFGDHAKMFGVMKENNFKLCLYQTPYTPTNLPIFEEGVKGGYFVKDREGRIIVNAGPMNFWSPEFAYVDYTNPGACRWIQSKVRKLLQNGCSVMKLDLCELYPENGVYANGMDGLEAHNFITEKYAKVTYEVTQEVQGQEACIWRRSGGIGSARYPVHWGGDVKSSWEEMAGQLRMILGAGLSGFVFFSHDIGGFQGQSEEDLYIRWFQLGMFTSHSRAHGGGPHEPWNKGPRALEICKKFALLRYSLLPHIYSAGIECCEEGRPMLQALYLACPDDPAVRNICDEYLFTDEILAAPILNPSGKRKIYLPEGAWIDYWNGRRHEGRQWIDYECGLESMPLFVREGSVIVRTEPGLSVPEKYWGELIFEVYAEGRTEKIFYTAPGDKHTITCGASASSAVVTPPLPAGISFRTVIRGKN